MTLHVFLVGIATFIDQSGHFRGNVFSGALRNSGIYVLQPPIALYTAVKWRLISNENRKVAEEDAEEEY